MLDSELPAAIVVDMLPNSSPPDWCDPIPAVAHGSGVPIVRCSIPSPGWIQDVLGVDACLVKPLVRQQLTSLFETYAAGGDVVLVGADPEYNSFIRRVVEQSGIARSVSTSVTLAGALRLSGQSRPALVVVDLGLWGSTQSGTLARLREFGKLGVPIVALADTDMLEELAADAPGIFTVTQESAYSVPVLGQLIATVAQVGGSRFGAGGR
jgi:CheY-like chemotaxis protein